MAPLHGRSELTRRRFLTAAAAAGGGLLLSACGQGDGGASAGGGQAGVASVDTEGRQRIRIGLVIPQSGASTRIGVDMLNGWQLWLDRNARTMGPYVVQTVPIDEGDGPDVGVPAISGAVRNDDVDVVVGVVNSETALGVLDVFGETRKTLLIANAGAVEITGTRTTPYVWRTSFTNAQNSYALGQYMGRQGLGRPFVISSDDATGQENVAAFTAAYQAYGSGQIVDQVLTPAGATTDFGPLLSQLRGAGPDSVFGFYSGDEAIEFVRQYASSGLKETTPLFGSGFLTEGGLLEAQGRAAIGVRTALHYSSALDEGPNQDFVLSYEQAYGLAPSCYAMATFDAAEVMGSALGTTADIGGDAMAEALAGVGLVDRSPRGDWIFEGQNPKQPIYLREVTERDGMLVNAVVENLGIFGQPTLA